MNIQTKILKDLRLSGKITPKKLAENTGLELKQVYRALYHLENRGLIVKNKVVGKAGYRKPPVREVTIEIREGCTKRIRRLIENG